MVAILKTDLIFLQRKEIMTTKVDNYRRNMKKKKKLFFFKYENDFS